MCVSADLFCEGFIVLKDLEEFLKRLEMLPPAGGSRNVSCFYEQLFTLYLDYMDYAILVESANNISVLFFVKVELYIFI